MVTGIAISPPPASFSIIIFPSSIEPGFAFAVPISIIVVILYP